MVPGPITIGDKITALDVEMKILIHPWAKSQAAPKFSIIVQLFQIS